MLSFFKKFLKKEKETLGLDELENWINNKTREIEQDNKEKTDKIKQNITEEISKAKQNLKGLENAELRNKNVPERELQFMQGNREAYIKRTNIFLDNIDIENKDFQNFEQQLNSFSKSTIRPYSILQNFFAHESSLVASNIRNISNMMNELKNLLHNKELEKINKIKESLENIKTADERTETLNKEIKKQKDNLKQRQEQLKELNEKISITKKGKDFKALQQDKEKREQTLSKIKELKEKLYHNFSIIEKAMKKYSRLSLDEKLVNEYIATPFKALLKDSELKILEIFSKLKESIEKNQVELKDKKQARTLETINNLNKEFFEGLLNDYKEFDKELDEINKKISENNISIILGKQNKQLDDLNSDIEKTKTSLENNENELNKINIVEMKKELEKEIKNNFDIEMSL